VNNKLKFLLVDDNELTNLFHKKIIERSGYAGDIHVSLNGMEAINYLQGNGENKQLLPPDLIFLDLNMPVMDGWEFIEKYENLPPEKRAKSVVLIVTTSPHPEDKIRAARHNLITKYYTKPLSQEMINEIISTYFKADATKN
jgi:CheY-like chemotaxis protein